MRRERTADGRRDRLCLTASLGDEDCGGLSEAAVFLLLAAPLLGEEGCAGEASWEIFLPFCFFAGLCLAALPLCISSQIV